MGSDAKRRKGGRYSSAKMKGLELPINAIVVIAIAVIVMIAIAGFFVSGFWNGVTSINEAEAFSKGCASLKALYECKASNVNNVIISGYNPPGTTNAQCRLGYLCWRRGASSTGQCIKLCGCLPIYGEEGSGGLDVTCGGAAAAPGCNNDGTCGALETPLNCPSDCRTICNNNGQCEPGETRAKCSNTNENCPA